MRHETDFAWSFFGERVRERGAHPFFRARIVIDFDEEEKEEKAEGIVRPRL